MELRTVKIDIDKYLDEDAKKRLKETMSECKEIFAFFAKLGCEHKSTNYVNLHHFGYHKMKVEFPNLPIVYIQNTAKQALASVKSFNTQHRNKANKFKARANSFRKHKNNKKTDEFEEKAKKAENRIWNYEGSKETFSLMLNINSLSRRGNLTTFSCIGKRIRVLHDIPDYFAKKYNTDSEFLQSGFVKYDESSKKYLLYLSFRVEQKECKGSEVIGIDRGLYNLAALSDGTIYNSKRNRGIKRKYQYLRNKLQQKGTRSAKRLLKKRSRREKRFMRDVNHCITKQLASRKDVSTYVLEDLTNIRLDTEEKARKKRKGKKDNPWEKGKRKLNSWLSNWSFGQFQAFLEYKCWDNGIIVVYVDPRYTSQKCHLCGKVDSSNRQGSRYRCDCGYSNHADVNAALNIRDNYLAKLDAIAETHTASESGSQAAVNQPYVTEEVLFNTSPSHKVLRLS